MHDSEACPRKSLLTGKAILNANDYKHISVASGFSENMGLCRGPVHALQKHSSLSLFCLTTSRDLVQGNVTSREFTHYWPALQSERP